MLQALTFTTPLALYGLLLLPVIWWLLRFTPPRPQTVRFPPFKLLLGLINREEQTDRTPWWLMLLRLLLAALLIITVAHPVYAPDRAASFSSKPLLIVFDDGWAAAHDWDKRLAMVSEILDDARRSGVTVSLATTAPELRPQSLEPKDAATVSARAAMLAPRALDPDLQATAGRLAARFGGETQLRVVWLSDGIDTGTSAEFAKRLTLLAGGRADVEVILPESTKLPLALTNPAFEAGRIQVTALRAPGGQAAATVIARAGNGRPLSETSLAFAAGSTKAQGMIELPVELRNEVSRIEIDGAGNAAAVYLLDDRWRRKTVALQSGAASENAQPLLSPLYYVSRAIGPFAEVSEPVDAEALKASLDQGLSMLILADIGVLPEDAQRQVAHWVERGGVLVRFAGPRLAGAQDGLVPVRLREGGRALGSALSWETPQAMQPFPGKSPFAGLALDDEVRISRQVLAEPDAELPEKVWAYLDDGTPLVTADRRGKGMIVLFHITANADWSNLPISGLFVSMLQRVLDIAPAAGAGAKGAAGADDKIAAFGPWRALNGFGELTDPDPDVQPISAEAIEKSNATPQTPAGLYRRGAHERAINLSRTGEGLAPVGGLPAGISVRSLVPQAAVPLTHYAVTAAMVLFLLDMLAALFLGGGFSRLRTGGIAAALAILLLMVPGNRAWAQADDDFAMKAALKTSLAFVSTGDEEIDRISEQGLEGLNVILRERTSIDPGEPVAINIERDELVFFPLLYWPLRPDAPAPSDEALAKLDAYMKNGGTVFFDLRDDGSGVDSISGEATGASLALRRMLAKLDIPPLEPVPEEHVLTRSFYLLSSFPGRYAQGPLWVEQLDQQGSVGATADGVSSIIIGSNDYAAAWAVDANGQPLYAVIPGADRQREFAYRSGINIVMYALTGNYKADQVHIPALLERLGQ